MIARVFIFGMIEVFTAIAFTLIYVLKYFLGASATGVNLLSAVTIRSPLYWVLLVIVLSAVGWLLRGWIRA